jgi:obg-like ATPase 1
VPAFLQVMDIAGLVKGASSGEGLGNAFLSHIAATDAIFHIIRVFEETADGDMATHVEGEVDPVRDLEIIAKELRLKDVAAVQKIIEPLKKEVGRDGKAKEKKDRLEIITKVLDVLDTQDKDIRFESWNTKETEIINELHLLTAKPALYLVNMSEKDFVRKKNKWLPKLAAWLKENRPGEKMMPYSAALEQKLFEMESDEERAKYCEESKTEQQMGKIVLQGYHTLQLVHFFTCGHDEVRAWTIREGWKAPQAAGTIHTDFERGFIKAETYNYAEWVANEKDVGKVKEAGKYKTEGKEYVVKDGDIIFFKFNVTAEKKK